MKISMYATKEEVRFCAMENGYTSEQGTLAQIYALYEIAHLKRAEIARMLDYAVSTVSTKRSKMWECAEIAEFLFGEGEAVAVEVEKAVEMENTILYRTFRDERPAVPMEFMPNCGANIRNGQAVYFFKFYDENELLFNKIGTSTKDVVGRLRDEIGEYSKKFDIRKVEIHRIFPCGNIPAEGAESALRAELINKYPNAFRKNDRFFNVDISSTIFDEIVSKYFGQYAQIASIWVRFFCAICHGK